MVQAPFCAVGDERINRSNGEWQAGVDEERGQALWRTNSLPHGGFGYGHVDTALRLENAPPKEGNPSILVSDVPQPPQHPQPQEEDAPMPEGLQGFINEITSHTRTIATRLLKVARLVENAPIAILEDDRFKKIANEGEGAQAREADTTAKLMRAQELFRFESRVIHWSDMLLLKPNTEIPTSIIDAWAAILNHNEEDRFSARQITIPISKVVCFNLDNFANPLGDEDERYKKFNDSYLVDETFAVETRVQNIQHFLFPIIASGHYYMIHFDPLCDRFDAIDNSSSVPKTEDKYGDVPKKLKENKDQLNALRVKYLTALVMSNLNEHRARNIQQASEFGLEG
nr:ulp1 protease family, C-terminal catalytic domain-containing protein [Ipomoea batatas]